MKYDRWNTPALHHVPWAHPGAAARAVYGEEIKLGVRGKLDGHGQFPHTIRPSLEADPAEANAPQVGHCLHEIFVHLFHHVHVCGSQPAVPGKRADGSRLKCLLDLG